MKKAKKNYAKFALAWVGVSFFSFLFSCANQPAAAAGKAVAAGVTNVSVGAAIDRLNWADTGRCVCVGGEFRANRKIEGTRERGEDGRTGGNQDGENIKEDGKERRKTREEREKKEKGKGKRAEEKEKRRKKKMDEEEQKRREKRRK